MKTKTINAAQLASLGACADGIRRFEELFGYGDVEVTIANALKVIGFDLMWFSSEVMPDLLISDLPRAKQYRDRCYAAWQESVEAHSDLSAALQLEMYRKAKAIAVVEFLNPTAEAGNCDPLADR